MSYTNISCPQCGQLIRPQAGDNQLNCPLCNSILSNVNVCFNTIYCKKCGVAYWYDSALNGAPLVIFAPEHLPESMHYRVNADNSYKLWCRYFNPIGLLVVPLLFVLCLLLIGSAVMCIATMPPLYGVPIGILIFCAAIVAGIKTPSILCGRIELTHFPQSSRIEYRRGVFCRFSGKKNIDLLRIKQLHQTAIIAAEKDYQQTIVELEHKKRLLTLDFTQNKEKSAAFMNFIHHSIAMTVRETEDIPTLKL